MKTRLLKVEIAYEHDVVLSRQRARQIAALLGFTAQDQVRIATAVSEIARNAFRYAKRGRIEFFVQSVPSPILQMILTDHGSGIPNLDIILEGKYKSRTGMGLGLIGAKRLMDKFEIETGPKGTKVVLEKFIPNIENRFDSKFLVTLGDELSRQTSEEPFVELQQQNQELLAAFMELEKRQKELACLNLELKNAKKQLNLQNEQLEDRVAERTCELKESLQQMERFCYSIAHDLKAPLRAINGMTMILQEDYAPAFDDAGKKCANQIIEAATRMDILIGDLLDYGRLTHMDVVCSPVNLGEEVVKALEHAKGAITSSQATIDVQKDLPNVNANPVLLQQVLGNLIENALKFVKEGTAPSLKIWAEERIDRRNEGTVKSIRLWIKDNGIGISSSYTARIFEVFERLHGEQSIYPGTGIGLALVQKAMDRMSGFRCTPVFG